MRVSDVKPLLDAIARGDTIEDASREQLDALVAADLVYLAPNRAGEREKLATLKTKLRAAADETARRALRSEILALSESLAMAEGGAKVALQSGGASYRDGGGAEQCVVLTQRGRTLVSDLEPRAERAASLDVSELEDQMELLRTTLESRAERAASLLPRLTHPGIVVSGHVARSVAIGLATRRESDDMVVAKFRQVLDAALANGHGWTPDRAMSAAEYALLVATSLDRIDATAWMASLGTDHASLSVGDCRGDSDGALHAAVVLATLTPERRDAVVEGARALRHAAEAPDSAYLAFPTALVAAMTSEKPAPALVARLKPSLQRLVIAGHPRKDALEALLLGLATGLDADRAEAQILSNREHVTRYAGPQSLRTSALLAWLDAPVSETIDDLRLAAAVLQTNRLALEPGEIAANAVKLLLLSALLAEGNEGDAEEKLVLGARMFSRLGAVGGGTIAVSIPALAGLTSAFVQPMLDAVSIVEAAMRQTQGYVASDANMYGHRHHYG